jgi:prepilin-type processing-associated H-X9-DG protein
MIDSIKSNEPADKYARAMEWATGLDETGAENIPRGEIIFNCTWDDFPKLFFYNTKHRYVYGLDPNYLYSEHPNLYTMLKDLTEGKIDDPAPLIRHNFGANYIFADAKENTDMLAKALESGWVETIYEDDEARLLKIREEKGEPPNESKDEEPPTPEEEKLLDEEERNDTAPDLDEDNDEAD